MKTVHEVSSLSGVSIRALHHYDEIGLLRPSALSPSGYRLYDEAALSRLRDILTFRELGFSLKEIAAILDSPSFDRASALEAQIELLELRKQRIEDMISLTRGMLEKGTCEMDFDAFDKSRMNEYREEVKKRWGGTSAYAESERRAAGRDEKTAGLASDGLTDIFREFGEIKNSAPSSEEARRLVTKLQTYITDTYYTCTDEILAGLGEMYTADERFRGHIDSAGGEGTARFVTDAIRCTLKKGT